MLTIGASLVLLPLWIIIQGVVPKKDILTSSIQILTTSVHNRQMVKPGGRRRIE
ncbi:hypothetical protein KC19_7G026200 [Ceratodon purpureus]|uniref:Uncharacterized protein n=1 Tax=Ceratodon purpureus TaxID=3225 RepID=A0A8T0H3R0_CERPU|nr:hypothetical protein KC19_7G026200 [Ceratodon purpureus]